MLEVVRVSVSKLREMADPFGCDVWSCGSILAKESVTDSLHSKRYKFSPYPGQVLHDCKPWSLQDHADRVAYLVVFGWCEPVQVDVGIPDIGFMPQWPIIDGNHRLAAAIFAGLEAIDAEVSGDCELISQILASSKDNN